MRILISPAAKSAHAALPWFVVSITLCGLLLSLWGCSSARSPRCKELCRQEALCVSELNRLDSSFDETGCFDACIALERDSEGRKLVDAHEACVNAADTCLAKMSCQ